MRHRCTRRHAGFCHQDQAEAATCCDTGSDWSVFKYLRHLHGGGGCHAPYECRYVQIWDTAAAAAAVASATAEQQEGSSNASVRTCNTREHGRGVNVLSLRTRTTTSF